MLQRGTPRTRVAGSRPPCLGKQLLLHRIVSGLHRRPWIMDSDVDEAHCDAVV